MNILLGMDIILLLEFFMIRRREKEVVLCQDLVQIKMRSSAS